MGLKSFDYYSNVPMAYPTKGDYTTIFVYSKGKTIVNGMLRTQINNETLKGYRDSGFKIEEDFNKDAYYAETRKYGAAQNALMKEFEEDLIAEHGLTGHPKAARAFQLAWDRGHSSGYQEVANEFDDLAELLKP